MAKVVCVLYDDPIDGYPTSYARDGLPELESYTDGQTVPTPWATPAGQGKSCDRDAVAAALESGQLGGYAGNATGGSEEAAKFKPV